MGTKATATLDNVHPQMLRVRGEGDRKKLADLKSIVGRVVERTFELAGVSKQEAAYAMGYSDPGTVSRWCAGTERAQFDKLLAVEVLRGPLVQALAEATGAAEVRTEITIRRTA